MIHFNERSITLSLGTNPGEMFVSVSEEAEASLSSGMSDLSAGMSDSDMFEEEITELIKRSTLTNVCVTTTE